jgi:hypothetical protein
MSLTRDGRRVNGELLFVGEPAVHRFEHLLPEEITIAGIFGNIEVRKCFVSRQRLFLSPGDVSATR